MMKPDDARAVGLVEEVLTGDAAEAAIADIPGRASAGPLNEQEVFRLAQAINEEQDPITRGHKVANELVPALAALPPITCESLIFAVTSGAGQKSLRASTIRRAVQEYARAPKNRAFDVGDGTTDPKDTRPCFSVDRDLAYLVDTTWAELLKSNSDSPTLFRTRDASVLTEVAVGDDGPAIRAHSVDSLRLKVARHILWERHGKEGTREASPPDVVVKSLLAQPLLDVPTLVRVVSAPVAGRDGQIMTTPGYHPASCTFYAPSPDLSLPDLPEYPSAADIRKARETIMVPLADFPFVGQAERAHAIAAILLLFVREMIDGPTPLHLLSKPAPGTGATLLCDVIALIATGRHAPVGVKPNEEDEFRKRLTAALLEGAPIMMLDNVLSLRGAALAGALTATEWTDRILSLSKIATLPVRCLWFATGNNPDCSNEQARRIVRIRLDARMERPWERKEFAIPRLTQWVENHRGKLVAAVLTLIRAWVEAGKPAGKAPPLGSYENWASVVGGILDVAGVPGFLGNLGDFYSEADSEGEADRDFVRLWFDAHGRTDVGVEELFKLADGLPIGAKDEKSSRTRLGRHLGRLRGRIVAGHLIAHGQKRHNAQLWHLADPSTPGERPDEGQSTTLPVFGSMDTSRGTSGNVTYPPTCTREEGREEKGRACAHIQGGMTDVSDVPPGCVSGSLYAGMEDTNLSATDVPRSSVGNVAADSDEWDFPPDECNPHPLKTTHEADEQTVRDDAEAPSDSELEHPHECPCYACRSSSWWCAGNGHWVCGVCHPPAPDVVDAGVQWWSSEEGKAYRTTPEVGRA